MRIVQILNLMFYFIQDQLSEQTKDRFLISSQFPVLADVLTFLASLDLVGRRCRCCLHETSLLTIFIFCSIFSDIKWNEVTRQTSIEIRLVGFFYDMFFACGVQTHVSTQITAITRHTFSQCFKCYSCTLWDWDLLLSRLHEAHAAFIRLISVLYSISDNIPFIPKI